MLINEPEKGEVREADSAASPVAVKIAGLTARYGDVVAVDNLDLEVRKGEMLVLLGPSGCGKTTTMRCLAGLEVPSSGSITIGGRVMFDHRNAVNIPANHRRIGMVFQSYAIWPHRTVFQNVAFPLRMRKVPKTEIKERVERMLETVGLLELGTRSASNLSGGQMQRVALARSLVMEPPLLLLDEPLSNLDAKLRDRLRFELKEVQQRIGVTSIYVTHDQSEALALADRIAVMNNGRIQQLDTPQVVYDRPANLFVADFFGVGNVLPGVVRSSADNSVDVTLDDGPVHMRISKPRSGLSSGRRVYLCFRSDEVTMTTEPPGVSSDNIVGGVVRRVTYLGSYYRYKVAVDDNMVLDVTAYGTQARANEGDIVYLNIAPDRIRVLWDEDDSNANIAS